MAAGQGTPTRDSEVLHRDAGRLTQRIDDLAHPQTFADRDRVGIARAGVQQSLHGVGSRHLP